MKRINEAVAAKEFVNRLLNGEFGSPKYPNANSGEYTVEKMERDTNAVREFANSNLFRNFASL